MFCIALKYLYAIQKVRECCHSSCISHSLLPFLIKLSWRNWQRKKRKDWRSVHFYIVL
ncbi:hypothetical protein X975_21883, partial [Stegodyphus mimosarum]